MKIAVIGAGTVGSSLVQVLLDQEQVSTLIVLDRKGNALDEIKQMNQEHPSFSKLRTFKVGMEKYSAVVTLVKGLDVMISALPYTLNFELARIAVNNGCHFMDLGGSDQVFDRQLSLHDKAREKGLYVLPNCGLAPGLLNIIAYHGYKRFDDVSSICIYSGGLPLNPVPPLFHHLSFSAHGFLSEHLPPVLAVQDGKPTHVEPLSGVESISFENRPELGELEAFYTGGHISTLAKTLQGSVENLSYKTIRHKGNHTIMQALLKLGLADKKIIDVASSMTYRDLMIRKLQEVLPETLPDIVLAKVVIEGTIKKKPSKKTIELVYEYDPKDEHSAIMTCTAVPTALIAIITKEKQMISEPGVRAPELAIPAEPFLQRIQEHGIQINETVS
ncbi:saccharopine dehydrogenase C-terminal domain-containing protein [Balneolaceae bacterium ANBcel3]|nr:saccharopine dehydrogenase C-terminal domain-containing protein [Balneolaceae bacterium ANBcel3]